MSKNDTTAIRGWVAIDEAYDNAFVYAGKPKQAMEELADTGGYLSFWRCPEKKFPNGKEAYLIDRDIVPEMDCDSEPIEVEITIKKIEK